MQYGCCVANRSCAEEIQLHRLLLSLSLYLRQVAVNAFDEADAVLQFILQDREGALHSAEALQQPVNVSFHSQCSVPANVKNTQGDLKLY